MEKEQIKSLQKHSMQKYCAVCQGTTFKMVGSRRTIAKPKKCKKVLIAGEGGEKRVGRPRKRWLQVVKGGHTAKGNKTDRNEKAKDRRTWKNIVTKLETI